MNIQTALFGVLVMASSAWAEQPVKLFYNSQTDFAQISLSLKAQDNANPQYVGVQVVLSPAAKARTTELMTLALNKSMTLYVNGWQLSTVTVHDPIASGQMQFQIPRQMLLRMMPSLMR
ncbi:hypothetical protein [Pseudomonas sp. B22129]|uniref:hypothetical protein n=1 Tax=Pseudomonas sp. B22129 TaxID=3235111 RepID=UPI0037835208